METNKLLEKYRINAINITAYRAIKIFKLLNEKPCSHKEIIENLKQDKITNRSISDDTLRATLNSLKAVGCNISRPSPANNYKYILNSHPFGLKLSKKQINILLKIRNDFLLKNDWRTVIAINDLYDKFAFISQDEEIHNLLFASKPFIRIKPEILEFLKTGKLENKEVIMNCATSAEKQSSIQIKIDSVFCHSGRIYLWGWYYKRSKYSYFNAEKIISIESIKPAPKNEFTEFYTATYKLYGEECTTFKADDEETIISRDNNSITIQYQVKSEFKFLQRLLNFGENFELIEPVYAKKILSVKLQKMLERYSND